MIEGGREGEDGEEDGGGGRGGEKLREARRNAPRAGDLRAFRTDGGEMVCSAPRGRFHQSEFKHKTSKYT